MESCNDWAALHGDPEPTAKLKHEKVWHRLAAMLALQGLTVTEIARRLGRTVPWVSQVLRQPWTRRLMLEELREAGTENLDRLIKAAATDSLFTLIELRDTARSENVRLNAAVQLVNRWFGTPTQRIEWKDKTEPVDAELRRIDEELKQLETEWQNEFKSDPA